MNAKAAEIASQIETGSVLHRVGPNSGEVTVKEITEKSVYFTNGKMTNKRSLHHYTITSV